MTTFPLQFPAFGDYDPEPSNRTPNTDRIVTDHQAAVLHTRDGIHLVNLDPTQYSSLGWGRALSMESRCTLTAPPGETDRLDMIETYRDWCTVFDDDTRETLWTGPIVDARESTAGVLSITAKDHLTYLTRTRVPVTSRWDKRDPSAVAGDLWREMAALHNIRGRPMVRPDPEGRRYDYSVTKDAQMLDRVFSDLAGMGLRYTVFAGTAILGPTGTTPVATLTEDDFEGDPITLVKDGSTLFNDVVVRGADNWAHARTDYYGQNLQTLVNRDSMFGVSNIQVAAEAYIQETGSPRIRLELAPNTVLKPTAPVTIDDLIPSNRFEIQVRGIRQLFELKAVDVTRQAGSTQTRVTMNSVNPKLELLDTQTGPEAAQGQEAG